MEKNLDIFVSRDIDDKTYSLLLISCTIDFKFNCHFPQNLKGYLKSNIIIRQYDFIINYCDYFLL